MRLIGDFGGQRSVFAWRTVVVGLAMLSLVVTLASRTIHLPQTNVTSLQANPATAKVQHRNMDGVRWLPPVQATVVFWPTAPSHAVRIQDEPLRAVFLDFGLYTRPPPTPESLV